MIRGVVTTRPQALTWHGVAEDRTCTVTVYTQSHNGGTQLLACLSSDPGLTSRSPTQWSATDLIQAALIQHVPGTVYAPPHIDAPRRHPHVPDTEPGYAQRFRADLLAQLCVLPVPHPRDRTPTHPWLTYPRQVGIGGGLFAEHLYLTEQRPWGSWIGEQNRPRIGALVISGDTWAVLKCSAAQTELRCGSADAAQLATETLPQLSAEHGAGPFVPEWHWTRAAAGALWARASL